MLETDAKIEEFGNSVRPFAKLDNEGTMAIFKLCQCVSICSMQGHILKIKVVSNNVILCTVLVCSRVNTIMLYSDSGVASGVAPGASAPTPPGPLLTVAGGSRASAPLVGSSYLER